MKLYISFGQGHMHQQNKFNKDVICEIDCANESHGRQIAFNAFGPEWALTYTEDQIKNTDMMKYFPGGIKKL
jgi:hypothetical protein